MKVISLGVGVQSTALYFMSSSGEIERADAAIFADTGGEKTATLEYYEYLQYWQIKNNGIPLYKADYKNLQSDLLNNENSSGNRFASIPAFTIGSSGKEGMLRRQCTLEYKIRQVDMKIKEILGLSKNARYPEIEIWNGITVDEIQRMSKPRQKWKTMVYPFCGYKVGVDGKGIKISDERMRRGDVIIWFQKNNLPIPEKSSCKFCPFQADVNWLRLKTTAIEDFNDAITIDDAIRDSSKSGVENPIYLHRSLNPLSQVKFDEDQTEMWGDCYGYCHI